MLPSERRKELKHGFVFQPAGVPQCRGRPLQIDGVPQHDRRCYQIQAAGPIALLLKAPIPNLAQPVDKTALAKALRASPLFNPACTRR